MIEKDVRLEEFKRLLDIIDELRVKCPWDMKQTNESLRKLTIEETYELAEAVISGNDTNSRIILLSFREKPWHPTTPIHSRYPCLSRRF